MRYLSFDCDKILLTYCLQILEERNLYIITLNNLATK